MANLWDELLACLDLLESPADLDSGEPAPPESSLWMRTPPVRPLEGLFQRDAHTVFTSAVTSHTLWFHRPFRTDGWLLRQHSPLLAHGRCFGRGDVLTEDGSLVASYAQGGGAPSCGGAAYTASPARPPAWGPRLGQGVLHLLLDGSPTFVSHP